MIAMFAILSACTGNSTMSREDIKIAAGELRNFASASSLLVQQASAGHSTDTFFLSQSELLRQKVQKTAESLEGSGGEFELERRTAAEISAKMLGEIGRIQSDR